MTHPEQDNRSPLILPRRQIGPDAIKMLRDISKQNTADRFTYDACKVQLHDNGTPSRDIDFASLEFIGKDHPASYFNLIRNKAIPRALTINARLLGADPSVIEHELKVILMKAVRGCGYAHWTLSAAPLRCLLFPAAYSGETRIDCIHYVDRPNDIYHRGRVAQLSGLSTGDVRRFHTFVKRIVNEDLDLKLITPLKSNSLHLGKDLTNANR